MHPSTSSRGRRSALFAVLIALGVLALLPGQASAGDYQVEYCVDAAGRGLPLSTDWMAVNNQPVPSDSVRDECQSGGGLMLAWGAAADRPAGADTAYALAAPEPLSMVRFVGTISWNVGKAGRGVFSQLDALANCTAESGACDPAQNVAVDATVPEEQRHFIRFTNHCNTACSGFAFASLYQPRVTFRDSAPPSSGAVGGPLMASGSGAPVSGTVATTLTATDAGSGVQRALVQVDGREIASSPSQCTAPYTRMAPCPASVNLSVPVDTTTIADGTHSAAVAVQDASGSTTTVWSGSLVVHNGGAIGPGTDLNVRGAINGSSGADTARLTAAWSQTAVRPSRRSSVRRRCRASRTYRRAHRTLCDGRAAVQQLRTNYSSVRTNQIAGRLLDAAGRPITGAAVQITATPRASGLPSSVVARPVTDAAGRFTARVPARTGSAVLSAAWLARARDTVPAAKTALYRSVRAATTFSVGGRKSIKRGQTLTMRGKLRGTVGELRGNAVVIQINPGSRWAALKTVRTRTAGRWTARYTIPRALRGRYRFRAVVTPTPSYPFATGAGDSKTLRIP